MTKDDIIHRIGELQTILDECEVILTGRDSKFWEILRRTYEAKVQSFKQDCYQAAESEDKSIRNFLGRMEGLEWAVALVEEDFISQARRAKEEILSLRAQLKELEEIDRGVESIVRDPMYQQPGTI